MLKLNIEMKQENKLYGICIILSCIVLPALSSCGKTTSEKKLEAVTDSIQTADSIADVEAERIEQEREDSINKDASIRAKIPQMKDFAGYQSEYGGVCFNDFDKISKKLKKKGYKEIVNKKWIPGQYNDALGEYEEGYEDRDYVWTVDSDVNIKIVTSDNLITLTFGDEYSQKLFMESLPAAGFKKGMGEYGGATNGSVDGEGHHVQGKVYHHPKGQYYCGVWVDETPGKVYLVYTWTY